MISANTTLMTCCFTVRASTLKGATRYSTLNGATRCHRSTGQRVAGSYTHRAKYVVVAFPPYQKLLPPLGLVQNPQRVSAGDGVGRA
eukprot:3166813-Rhodomonas_salina.3